MPYLLSYLKPNNEGFKYSFLTFLFIGFFYFIPAIFSVNIQKENNITIFIATHKDFEEKVSNRKVYKIITDDEFTLKNKYYIEVIPTNENNHLYQKKIGYSELSKYYYIWKNYKPLPKYIGFCHYRRYYSFYNDVPNMDEIFSKHDVILNQEDYGNGPIYESFTGLVFRPDMKEVVEEIIKEKFPLMYETANKFMNGNKGHWCNIFIMKREDFLEYGNFVFTVLEEYDRRRNINTNEDIKKYMLDNWDKYMNHKMSFSYNVRHEAFIAELLSNIFYNYQFKNPKEIQVIKLPYEEHIMKRIFRKIIFPSVIFLFSFFGIIYFRRRFFKKSDNKEDLKRVAVF